MDIGLQSSVPFTQIHLFVIDIFLSLKKFPLKIETYNDPLSYYP